VIYATVIAIISIISVSITLYEARDSANKLREMSKFETMVNVYRIDQANDDISIDELIKYKKTIKSTELVPGDVVEIPEYEKLPCDIIIL
jgi:cation-transporting P-type ATPase 13A2